MHSGAGCAKDGKLNSMARKPPLSGRPMAVGEKAAVGCELEWNRDNFVSMGEMEFFSYAENPAKQDSLF